MKKSDITKGVCYLEVPEVNLRILCGCPENSIKFLMQKGLTPPIEVNGMKLVSGPNAILLNDISILNSHFLNFAEFPVLHQQYFQGAAFNGTGEKFVIIGKKDKVDNQYNYIRRGLHGLDSIQEVLETGVSDDVAQKIVAIGNYHRGYANDFNILDKIYINAKTKIKGDLYIERLSINCFKFTYKEQEEIIDINLGSRSKGVGLPYNLDHKFVEFTDFSVTTIGDGNGWNPDVPCMSSLLTCNGKRYLIDSGPGSLDLIRYLGVMPSELEGIFVTHSHDDHFAGILSMLNSENKIKFLSTGLIISSVQKKFLALLNIDKKELKKYIDFIELKENVWTNVGDMEVKPNYSFHTIETNVFYFRILGDDGIYKSYGHITDIVSKKDLNYMIDNDKSGIINREWTDLWFNHYLEECDLKRIDAGGGVVHGDSHDFVNDKSKKIILSHLNHGVDTSISENFYPPTDFGHTEVLIKSNKNFLKTRALNILSDLTIITDEVNVEVLEENILLFKPNVQIYKAGEKLKNMYLVLSGLVTAPEKCGHYRKYVQGDFLYKFNGKKVCETDFKTSTYTYLLKVDFKTFYNCLKHVTFPESFIFIRENRYFSYGFSLLKLIQLAHIMVKQKVKKMGSIVFDEADYFFVNDGVIEVYYKDELVSTLNKNSLSVFPKDSDDFKFKILENSTLLLFKESDASSFISLLWSIFEESKKIESIVEMY